MRQGAETSARPLNWRFHTSNGQVAFLPQPTAPGIWHDIQLDVRLRQVRRASLPIGNNSGLAIALSAYLSANARD